MSARLSPAASLLRHSKLFALPPAIALPAAAPSSDQVSSSDTATTVYPQHAAIETTTISGSVGDWGFKRPLPLKTTKTTNNPVVRLVRGIDTDEHVADFESAADHALTLRKFQQLNQALRHPEATEASYQDRNDHNVFRRTHDNTTDLSSSSPAHHGRIGIWPSISAQDVFKQLPNKLRQQQIELNKVRRAEEEAAGVDPSTSGAAALLAATSRPPSAARTVQRRWRYSGPSLVQMSGMQFDDYVYNLGQKEKDQLVVRVKREIVRERLVMARDEGKMDDTPQEEDVTDGQVNDYMRHLRNEPSKFGPMLTEMLDIPEGALPPQPTRRDRKQGDAWMYGRDTLAAKDWQVKGPPRTHPSAGLSYVHHNGHVNNDPIFGPQLRNAAVTARAVKTKSRSNGLPETTYGVAGFIVNDTNDRSSTRGKEAFAPRKGGAKIPVTPTVAYISEEGTLKMKVNRESEEMYAIVDDKVVSQTALRLKGEERVRTEARRGTAAAPRLSGNKHTDTYHNRTPTRHEKPAEAHDSTSNVDGLLAKLYKDQSR